MVKFIYDTSEETRIKEIARLREKALHDEASALKNAKAEGRAEGEAIGMVKGRAEGRAKGRAEGEAIGMVKGRAEGRAEGEASIIAKMKAFGMTEEQIRRIISDT